MAYGTVFHALGWLIAVLSVTMVLPVVFVSGADVAAAGHFLRPAILGAFLGVGLVVSFSGRRRETGPREAMLLAVLAFAVLPVLASLPLIAVVPDLGFIGALFESVSGFTTTGASVLEPAALDLRSHVWRALLEWLGGLGVVTMAATLLSGLGQALLPVRPIPVPSVQGEPSIANLLQTLRLVAPLYLGITTLLLLLLMFSGLGFPAAFCLTASALATGGFTGPAGMPQGTLPLVSVALGFAFGSFNLLLHWYGARGRFAAYRRDPESLYLAAAIASAVAVFAVASIWFSGWNVGSALFNALSLMSTSGMVLEPDRAARLPLMLLVVPALIGGSAVSTAGGMKVIRIVVMMKQAERELLRLAHPHSVRPMRVGERRVDVPLSMAVWASFAGFGILLSLVTVALGAAGFDFHVAVTAAVAAVSNTGPLLHLVEGAPDSYADFASPVKLLLGGAMIAGRLEVLLLLCMLNPAYWRS